MRHTHTRTHQPCTQQQARRAALVGASDADAATGTATANAANAAAAATLLPPPLLLPPRFLPRPGRKGARLAVPLGASTEATTEEVAAAEAAAEAGAAVEVMQSRRTETSCARTPPAPSTACAADEITEGGCCWCWYALTGGRERHDEEAGDGDGEGGGEGEEMRWAAIRVMVAQRWARRRE